MSPETIALGLMWFVIFLLSLTCHEASHALAAKWGGDPTAFRGGQVTLNPIPHIKREPFGTVVFPILSYLASGWMMGWASAPYDPVWQRRHPRRAAWMALAGPMANLALVLVAALAIHAGIFAGIFNSPRSIRFTRVVAAPDGGLAEGMATFLSILFSLNLLLAAFNLLPIPPLDGITAVGLFFKEETAARLAQAGRHPSFTLVGMIVAWRVFDYLFDPLFTLGLKLLYPGLGYH